MDSVGLGELVEAYAAVKNRGGALKLVHVGRRLRDLLVVSRMLTVFDAHDSEDDALASFTRHPLPGETRKERGSRAVSGKPAERRFGRSPHRARAARQCLANRLNAGSLSRSQGRPPATTSEVCR